MRRLLPVAVLVVLAALVSVPSASSAVRVVAPFEPADHADDGAIGLVVPGAGPTVTRDSALNTLLTGEVETSHLGGTRPGEPRIVLGAGPPPDVLVVLPPAGESANDRYPIALVGDGVKRGVLTSDSTRIAGLVSLADIAADDLRVEEVDDPVATLETLERRIDRNDSIRLPLQILLAAIAIAVAVLVPRLGPRVFLVALALNLWLAGWWLVAPLAVAVAVLPLGPACALLIAIYLAALGLDPETVALSPFGPSQAGRFYGVSNLLATMLLLPALLGAALGRRFGAVVALAALVMVGTSWFGADGGGLLVLLAGYATLWLTAERARVDGRRVVLGAAAVVAVAVAVVLLDAAVGGSSHVTAAAGDGPGGILTDLVDRWEISVRRTLEVAPLLVCAASLAVLGWIVTRRPLPRVTTALLVALGVSLLVNDTPVDVLSTGAVAALTLWRFEPHTSERAG